jgi:autonomous glycyl radical cofactor GrcA
MTKISKEQIAAWKEEYKDIYQLSSADGKVGYVFDPTAKFSVMKMIAAVTPNGQTAVTDAILNNCWLGGDEEIRTIQAYKNELDDQIDEIFNIPDYEIKEEPTHAVITSCGVSVKVRYPERTDLKDAEKRNKLHKPFDTNIYLLEALAMDDLTEIKKNNRVYLGVILCIREVKQKLRLQIKKF